MRGSLETVGLLVGLAWLTAAVVWGAEGDGGGMPTRHSQDHWAFQPLAEVPVPLEATGARTAIDAFVQRRLRAEGLQLAPPAEPLTLVRRMFLDLHGLPPTPDEVDWWSQRLAAQDGADSTRSRLSDSGVRELIDHLLASPRYGERWGQHWLDIVRYADTHGYEVNTPRPNAWPYRDYVIRAFNEDKPYDRFVFEQLAGDQVGVDAATGFLVAAPVLLPGQIGKDDASIRLARQDALDEIIVGTSATFLGLTIGCARCHDHKFDPIAHEDYYAMQAFFAGVEYEEREVHDEAGQQRLAEAARLAPRIAKLRSRLAQYQPLAAVPGSLIVVDDEDPRRTTSLKQKNGHGTNPEGAGRGYRDDAGTDQRMPNLSGGRYTWWDNVPGEDVFTWNPGVSGSFRLWISWGVHGSGVHTRDARYVLDQDGDLNTAADQLEVARADQYLFARQTDGESEEKPLWSGLYDAGVHVWSSESRLLLRGGETGTGITADVIVLQQQPTTASDSQARTNAETPSFPPLRAPVTPLRNVETFEPVMARYVRFTTLETIDDNRHEPCIDELEVYAADESQKNVALASSGTVATSSGNYSETGRHQLKHVNDGRYGNARSWISNKRGGGWVQLQFAQPVAVDRVEWGRDREGKYQDRLPVRYRIDVSLDGDSWTPVASSSDRIAIGTAYDETSALLRNGGLRESEEISELTGELRELEQRKQQIEQPRVVFAGKFREPDETRVLLRGDPEQPDERIGPRVPTVLGTHALPLDSSESQRRAALADWIASDQNPLTARVMANRVWQYHFGRGLVETSSDFGVNGAEPTHPELLDWLAAELIRSGWSLKHLHRQIMSADTYRQSARIDAEARRVDARCELLWRFPSRRLEAEAIRDGMLQASGALSLRMGGPGFDFFQSRGGLSGFPPVEEFGPDGLRRMIYAHKIRMEPVPVFGAFDCPDAGQATPQRSQSTTAIQALNLFNSPFVYEQARQMAARVAGEVGQAPERQVERAFRIAFGRMPTARERHAALGAVERHGLELLCRVLFNSNEFLFLP